MRILANGCPVTTTLLLTTAGWAMVYLTPARTVMTLQVVPIGEEKREGGRKEGRREGGGRGRGREGGEEGIRVVATTVVGGGGDGGQE